MEPVDRHTVVCDPGTGRKYDPETDKEFFPRPPDPCNYDPATVRAALFPETVKERSTRANEEIAVIVTQKDDRKGFYGSIVWRIARMRRATYEWLRDGGRVDPSCVVFECASDVIDTRKCDGHLDSEAVRKVERKEAKRLSKLFGFPYLLRFQEVTETKRYVRTQQKKRD